MRLINRKLLIIGGVAVFCMVALGIFLPLLGEVEIRDTGLGIQLYITRNGQIVLADQIQSIQYRVDVKSPQPLNEVDQTSLREAVLGDNFCLLGAPLWISRSGAVFPSREVEPDYRSVFLHVTFADNKTFSLNVPIVADAPRDRAMYIDFSDASH